MSGDSPDPIPVLPSDSSGGYVEPPEVPVSVAPVSALPYSMPSQGGRPGILTAISIISIVLASLGAIFSLGMGCESVVFMQFARVGKGISAVSVTPATPAPVIASPPASAAPASQPAFPTGQNGLDPADRAVAVKVLLSLQPMDEDHQRQLDAFLAERGQDVFPTAGRALDEQQVKAIVTRSGPSSKTGDSDSFYFITSRGTFTVYDDKVMLIRAGSRDAITVSADQAAVAARATGPGGYGPLTAVEAKQVSQIVNKMGGSKFNSAQLTTLETQLQSPQQQLLPVGSVPSPVMSVTAMPDGSMFTQFVGGSTLSIDTSGKVTQSFSAASFMTGGGPGFSASPFVAVAIESLLNLALAVLLLVAAIQVLRQAPSGRRLHLIWAWTKIPIAVLGGLSLAWMYSDMTQGFGGAFPTTSGTNWAFIMTAAVTIVLGCIYPIALLITFRTRAIREYYNVVQV